ncbi:hypothetical protein [Streptomyces sp. MBT33]|uniref:hypothetical protein n=1 Tax=Streptomyces sp. MBT33 TaxID=1488363 RepID=UPI0027DC0016|nr:hypothetical protein [Streptomyces sp. MBT33]
MTDTEKIAGLFAALGADDPHGWAESEVRENLPQLARYRLLRALWQDVEAWDGASIGSLRSDMHAEGAADTDSPVNLDNIARHVARETTFNVLYRLADPDSDDVPAGIRQMLPGWVLTETTPDGDPTHRPLNALYEDLDTVVHAADAPQDRTVAAGRIWENNLRPFCESLAAEAGYDFEDSDWQAIATALPNTDDEQPPAAWYAYPLVGHRRIDLHMAQAVGGSEVSVRIEGAVDSRIRTRVGLLVDIMARYKIASE